MNTILEKKFAEELKKVENDEKATALGLHLISICDIRSGRAKRIEGVLEMLRAKREFLIKTGQNTEKAMRDLWTEYNRYLKQLHQRFLVRQFCVKNKTLTTGRSVTTALWAGTTTNPGVVTYTAIGTSSVAPAITDTKLGNETYRKAISPSTYANNVAYLETFFSSTEVNGDFEEFGFVMGGSLTLESGTFLNRFTQPVSKSNVESMNVQSIITFNDAS